MGAVAPAGDAEAAAGAAELGGRYAEGGGGGGQRVARLEDPDIFQRQMRRALRRLFQRKRRRCTLRGIGDVAWNFPRAARDTTLAGAELDRGAIEMDVGICSFLECGSSCSVTGYHKNVRRIDCAIRGCLFTSCGICTEMRHMRLASPTAR